VFRASKGVLSSAKSRMGDLSIVIPELLHPFRPYRWIGMQIKTAVPLEPPQLFQSYFSDRKVEEHRVYIALVLVDAEPPHADLRMAGCTLVTCPVRFSNCSK